VINNIQHSEKNNFSPLNYFIVGSSILLSKSLYYETYGDNLLLFPFLFVLFVFGMMRNVKIDLWLIIFFAAFLLLALLNQESNFSSVGLLALRSSLVILIISIIPFKIFSLIFLDIIKVICFFSLFGVLFYELSFKSFLPYLISIDGRVMDNFLLFAVDFLNSETVGFRNNGLWWEPGAFQLFINIAFLFQIITGVRNLKLVILFALTIFSTASTAGIVCFLALLFIYLKSQNHVSKNKLNIFYGSIVFIIFYIYFGNSVISKVITSSDESFSFVSRFTDFQISIALFLENPVIGYGYANQDFYNTPTAQRIIDSQILPVKPTGADGITMHVAQLGLLGLPFLLPLINPGFIKDFNLFDKLLISGVLLILFNTQNFNFILIFNLLMGYGFVQRRKRFKIT